MKDVEDVDIRKGDKEILDTTKADVEKTEELKDDNKKARLPLTSSSLSMSFGFGNRFLAHYSDISLTETLKDTTDVEINSLLDIKIQYEVSQIQSPSILTVPVSVILELSILLPIPETTTTTSLVISTITPVLQQQSTLIPTPPITTEAPTFTTVVPETPTITTAAFNAVQLRVADLEKDVTELKKVDHSAEIRATIRSQVPVMVNEYLGSSLGDVLHKVLQKHTVDLIQQQSQKQSIDLEQEPTKSTLEILKVKKEQEDKQKMTKYTIKSTNKAALNEYDLKHALFQSMNDFKSFNKHPANQALYHALMEALIADEEAMDKGVADSFKQQKRPHGDEDEDPSTGLNQGKKTKRTRTKESESSKKTYITKETSRGNAPTKDHTAAEEMVHNVEQPQYASKPKTDKTSNWFIQPPRPPTPDTKWNTVQVVDDSPEEPWFNNRLSAKKDPLTFDALMDTPIDFSKFAMNRLKIDKLTKAHLVEPCFKELTNKLDWNNPEGYRCPFDLTKHLPLTGRSGRLNVAAEYFFNSDLEFLKSSDQITKYTTSITKTKATWESNTEKILSMVCVKVEKLHGYGHLEEIVVRRADRQLYKFKEGDFVDLHLNDIEDMLFLVVQHKLFQLDDNDIVEFIVALRIFIISLIIKRPVEDVQLDGELQKET
ncbi:hypothetical protein Tco_1106905 [Tanacetum coccineum]